jgi:hypothetical protein
MEIRSLPSHSLLHLSGTVPSDVPGNRLDARPRWSTPSEPSVAPTNCLDPPGKHLEEEMAEAVGAMMAEDADFLVQQPRGEPRETDGKVFDFWIILFLTALRSGFP